MEQQVGIQDDTAPWELVQHLIKLNIHLLKDLPIPCLGIYPSELNTEAYTNLYTHVYCNFITHVPNVYSSQES